MLVREYFAGTVSTWEDVYRSPTLYSSIYRGRLRAALGLVDRLRLPPGSDALDVGCGPGFGAVELARRGLSVCAVDAVDRMVELTLERAAAQGVRDRVRGAVADIHSLPFDDATFDVAFVIGVSEWLDRLEPPLIELARVLRPGGHLILSADNSWALSCLLDPLQNPLAVSLKRALGVVAHRLHRRPRALRTRAYSGRDLDGALRAAGLARTTGLTLGFGPFSLFNRRILPDPVGHALDRRLQALALRDGSPLRGAGLVHVVAGRKP
jgi:SAM-dependent methyltransferase